MHRPAVRRASPSLSLVAPLVAPGLAAPLAVLLAVLLLTGCASAPLRPPVTCQPANVDASELAERDYPFTNLVLQGGGVKGVAYAGMLRVLEQAGVAENLERVAGTSAGSIAAMLISLDYGSAELQTQLLNLNFNDFEDGGGICGLFRLFDRFGFYSGDFALEWLRDRVGDKTGGNRRATFAELKAAGFRDLYVVATDLNTTSSKIFSAETTPEHEVALAVRMSMSIPLFFAAVEDDGQVFVDGGVMWNYAIQLFDGDQVNVETMGAYFDDPGSSGETLPVDDIGEYAKALFEAVLDSQVNLIKFDRTIQARSAAIDDLGIPATDFQLTLTQKCHLIENGAEGTKKFLADWRARQLQEALDAQGGRVLARPPIE